MNRRVLSQKKAAWMKYRIKIRRYTSPSQRTFARSCLLMDYMRIGMRSRMDYAKKRRNDHEDT